MCLGGGLKLNKGGKDKSGGEGGGGWRGRVNYTQVANDNCRDPLIPFSIILCGQEPDIGEWSMWGWGGKYTFFCLRMLTFGRMNLITQIDKNINK